MCIYSKLKFYSKLSRGMYMTKYISNINISLCFLVIIFLVSCATSAKYGKLLDTWKGNNINNLISNWGAPSSTYKMSNGNTIYTYMRSRSGTIPIYNAPQTTTHQGTVYGRGGVTSYSGTSTSSYGTTSYMPVTWTCKTEFTVDERDTIINWRFQGNDCRSNYDGE